MQQKNTTRSGWLKYLSAVYKHWQ